MCRSLPQLAASIALFTLAFVVLPINAEDNPKRDPLEVVVYPVADLPVWTAGGMDDEYSGFNPKVLVALIKSTIGPERWRSGEFSILKHPQSTALVIRTTRKNQQKIAELLGRFRKPDPREETETISQDGDQTQEDKKGEKQPDTQSSNIERVRTEVLNAIFRAERHRSNSTEKAVGLIDAEIQKVESADLTKHQKSSLLESLRRCRKGIVTGKYPESESKELSQVREIPPTVLSSNDKVSKRVGDGERASYHSIDPEWDRIKQYIDSPHRQAIDLPADVEVLVKRLAISTPEHSWPTWEEAESPYLPTTWPGLHLRSR